MPTARVVCDGKHVVCTMAACTIDAHDRAACRCWIVNGTNVVSTDEIQNATVRKATQARCTDATPCGVDEAPVCEAVHEARGMVSTFSWTDWCRRAAPTPVSPCPSSPWAACMTAPCTADAGGDPGVASCACRVVNSAWLPLGGGACAQPAGRAISTVPAGFDMRVIPGAAWVLDACGLLPEEDGRD